MKRFLIAGMLILTALPASAATPREQTQSTLKNGATAEESYRVDNDTYTERNARLKDEGLSWNEDRIRFFVSWATADGFCLHARHDSLSRPWHYESKDGLPESGPCPSTRDARKRWRDQMNSLLADAAVAQESYRTTHDGYADNMADLRAEGFRNPYEEIKVSPVNVQTDYYCMQAMHRGMDVGQYFDINEGAPRTGGCPG